MALPKAVQRQVEAADAIVQTLQEPAPVAPVEPPVAPAVTPPAESASQPPAPQAPTEDWQQKYRSLQGIFAQKVAELQSQNRTYESQMSDLQRQMKELASRTERPQEQRQAADPKDVETFGADMIEMVQRYAEQVFRQLAEQFSNTAAGLESRVAAIEEKVQGVATKTDTTLEQQFYTTLNQLVPDWEAINSDQRWLQWLAEVDPIYGVTRQVALDTAHKTLNAQRVAGIFSAFKATHPSRKQDSLANQVAPSGAAAQTPTPAQSSKPFISAKSVEKFYKDLALNRYEGREAEAAAMEAEINLAASEGRIR